MRIVLIILLVTIVVMEQLVTGCNRLTTSEDYVPTETVNEKVENNSEIIVELLPTATSFSEPLHLDLGALPIDDKAGDITQLDAVLATDLPREDIICSPLGEHEISALAGIVSSPYTAPPVGREERHHGVDFAYYQNGQRESIAGETVKSVTRGRVVLVLQDRFPYGNAVVVETRLSDLPVPWDDALDVARREYSSGFQGETPGSVYFLYAHLQDAPLIEMEQRVNACTPLGVVGKSGNAGVAHLHLELRLGPSGAQLDDMGYYLYEITPEQREAYLRWRTSGEFQHIDPMVFLNLK